MSNETDLDWLARNVHVWPCGKHQPWCYVVTKIDGERTWASNVLSSSFPYSLVDKDQWLSRRAELQNKPSFADHPDAKCFVQNDSGTWFKNRNSTNVIPESGGGWFDRDMSCGWTQLGAGEVLGDWRDTLEKRPEEFKPSIEEANRLAQDFKPFISIEDNQELSMAKQQEVKQDNRWFERGELPPVGVECEAKKYGKEEWYKVVICGAGKHLGLAVAFYEKQKGSDAFTCSSAEYFRPIRTERDVLIEIISSNLPGTTGQVADAIIAAGFKLEAK